MCCMQKYSSSFSHPDYTVGSGITPDQPPWEIMTGRGLYRRWGITPRPEELMKFDVGNYSTEERKNQVFLFLEIQTIMLVLIFCEICNYFGL